MGAHGPFGHCRPPFKHGAKDSPVLLDQDIDRRAGGQAQETETVELCLLALDDIPHAAQARTFGQTAVKQVVLGDESFGIGPRVALGVDRGFQLRNGPRPKGPAAPRAG